MEKKIIYFMFGTFVLIYWFQYIDKSFNKKNNFEKFKIPVLSSAIVGLISQYICGYTYGSQFINPHSNQEIFTEVASF